MQLRAWVVLATVAMLAAAGCDDGGETPDTDTGNTPDMEADGTPEPEPDVAPEPEPDTGPQIDMAPDPECDDDGDCAADSVCGVGRCVEGACAVEPVEGCCEGDGDCAEGETCDLESNTCVADDPCADVACDDPPAPACDDEGQVLTFGDVGTCEVVDGAAECRYEGSATPCEARQICESGACVPDTVVDGCIFVGPADVELFTGSPLTLTGRVFEAGLTDLTDGVDPDGQLVAEAGWRVEGAEAPMWAAAEADPAWSAEAAGAAGYDQYLATVDTPPPGTYALSFRFSVDGGASWLRCDLDGSENGFQDAQTGTLTAVAGPCDDDPCAAAPPPACDGDVAVTYADGGACEAVDGEAACTHDEVDRQDCAAAGGRCEAGACVDLAPRPAAGEVIITEILYDALDPLSDENAEWFEVLNLADGPRYLGGCELYDAENVEVLDGGLLPAGGRLVFGHTADLERNGGVAVDVLFDFRLANDGDLIGLRCGGDDVDEVDYTQPGFAPVAAASLSLDPSVRDAGANDDGPGWCPAADDAIYFGAAGEPGAHRGTPGAANPPCPPPTVDYCRLQFPETVRAEQDTGFDVFGIVYEATWTDQTPAVDLVPGLMAEAGIGPDGSDPSDDPGWQWVAGAGNPGWDGADRGEPANDEYIARLTVPAPGEYDFAFRFSLDQGVTWTYCDLGAGSNDGYAPAQAGQLTAIPIGGDPCDGFVCPPPPAPRCADDGTTIIEPQPPGVCEAVAGQAQCTYAEDQLACPPGSRCVDGACFVPARVPAPGEIVITEFLYDAIGDLADGDAEWIELHNPTGDALGLDGCFIGDDGGNLVRLEAINIAPGGYALLARSDDPAVNGGLEVAGTFDFGLGNDRDRIVLTCGQDEIDSVAYDVGQTFPEASAFSVSLDPGSTDAIGNDDGANWCRTLPVYFEGPEGDHHGTPGAANPACPRLNNCILLTPDELDAAVGADVETRALLAAAGITDASRQVDDDPRLRRGAGYGPAGTDPALDRNWQWFQGQGDPDNDAQNADTYVALLAALPSGRYDVAWRFSVDDGRTYAYCDREPGSVNGYLPADAGHVTIGDPADPCDPNPCDAPPAGECRDADTAVVYPPLGACAVEAGLAVCDYADEIVACPLGCVDGACVRAEARAPAPGDLVISEIMYDPHDGLDDNTAEYFELYNAADEPLLLEGCVFADAGAESPAPAVEIEPGAYAVFARSDDPAVNGGLEVAGTFGFALNNTDDTLTVTCGGLVVDQVSYDERTGFPPVRAFSIQLRDGRLDPAANDDPASWCPSRTRYSLDPPQWGSPGAPNPPCDSEVDFCRLQFPVALEAEVGSVEIVYGRIYEEGLTDLGPLNDATGLIQGEAGFGPAGSMPMDNPDWVWTAGFENGDYDGAGPLGELNNDEHRADMALPELPGEYDFAFRFSVDGGRTWQVCDGGDAGSSDGYRVEDAGRLVVLPPANPCDPNPCLQPPASFCDGNTAVGYPGEGVCGVDELGLATCDYPEDREDCGETVCVLGACGGARRPTPGEVIVSEIMYDPHDGLDENFAEWIELYNTSASPLNLEGCELADSASGTPIVGVEIAARGYALFALTDDPALNGGLVDVDGTFDFALTNGGDTVNLRCDGQLIDAVSYDDGVTFPDARAIAINLSNLRLDAEANDLGRNWCLAEDAYLADPRHLGTPRGPNIACPVGDPCDPNPCPQQPPVCEGAVAVSYGPSACEADGDQPVCLPPQEFREDCGIAGCIDGGCDPEGARVPEPGDIVVTEIMRNTEGDIEEQFGEWFEMVNVTGDLLDLSGCEARDRTNGLAVGELLAPPGAVLLFGRSANPGINGGIVVDALFNFSLNNAGDVVELRCGVTTIDAVDYALEGFPGALPAVAYQLDPDLVDHELNDLGEAWCNAPDVYYDGNPPHLGSPGLPNPTCGDNLGLCSPNPCVEVPEDECIDGTNLAVHAELGTCALVDGGPTCEYDFEIVDCALDGQVCAAGRCLPAEAVAGAGDVIVSEVMYDPAGALADGVGEWIELYNTTDRELVLDGCTLSIEGGAGIELRLTLAAGGRGLLARSDDPASNGGLPPVDQVFDFALPNAGARLNLDCGGVLVDTMGYDDGFTFPDAEGASINLDPDSLDADGNDSGFSWCLAEAVYFADPGGDGALDNRGTPGAPNTQCPDVDITVDYCRFNFPVLASNWRVDAFSPDFEVYGIIYEEGITDRSPQVDFDGNLRGEGGYGPRGSDPDQSPDWIWTQAADNVGWNGDERGEPNNDEYIARFPAFNAQGGEYDMAFRFSVDAGQTWTYCDLDGSENGYSSDQAVDLTIERDPCSDVFCFQPPPSFCQSPTTVAFYDGNGQCVLQNDEPICEYQVNFVENCADRGQVCVPDEFGAFCVDP